MAARYFIGIDLGTSNCALSYIDSKDPSAGTQVFSIPQYASLDSVCEANSLPSFAYYLSESEQSALGGDAVGEWNSGRVVGLLARELSGADAARSISSAKSWLCHGGIDRELKLLPWKSEQIEDADKCSPVEASAAYLDYLRFAWDQTIGSEDKQSLFERQEIVITVPASFDTVAQRLTLDAAEQAHYPKHTRLLEEPQAAFYAWLETHGDASDWSQVFGDLGERPQVVCVCDIGGGTSDFSLFELSRVEGESLPQVRRIAVSNHILLGGDNIDLALAHMAEAKLSGSSALSGSGWSQLVAQCRGLKERVLSTEGPDSEPFTIALAGSGGSLFDSVQTVTLTRSEMTQTVLEGFFPACAADAQPANTVAGLREIGLPYAQDSAITHHLADFIRGRKVDALLFNGGTLAAGKLRERLADQMADWQAGQRPAILANASLELAVARGAAWYRASLSREHVTTIEGGSGHSFYIEVSYSPKRGKKKRRSSSETRLVCVLAQGSPMEKPTRVTGLNLALKVNMPVQFQAYTSTCREGDQGGDLVVKNEHDFHKLPVMQTMAQLPVGAELPEGGDVAIELEARLNSLGLLRVNCVSVRRILEENRVWRLEFNLRQAGGPGAADETAAPALDTGVSSEDLEASKAWIADTFGPDPTEPASKLLKALERISHLNRREWNVPFIRELWQTHASYLTRRDLSPEHELAWLNAAGFFLRPGYGHALDPYFIRSLWAVYELDLAHANNKANREQYFLLWRRVAGGLDAAQQGALYEAWIDKTLQDSKQSYEPARMLGAFEHITAEQRTQLAHHFTASIVRRETSFCDHAIWALGRVLNRVPLYGGEQAILPANEVQAAFDQLEALDWSRDNLRNLRQVFVQAARIVNNRDHDVPEDLRGRILAKVRSSGASEQQVEPLRQFTPIDAKDIQQLFGESLPVGLRVSC
ncbi:Hsp70 family protein [Coraliomargarita sp. SDUM461003]|uniref:Hsp70 family protein n=1 Tax=Thalassobacterium maritimum TaxID=3041265 RepID=A0ABU1AUI7_9BACT|nr:Hsp70 family protein [Coraliomargarita sp. SDUM461003]MDQ8207838.1 Hsp70 family protein [Coraliomargarita sp. SDUM461003]